MKLLALTLVFCTSAAFAQTSDIDPVTGADADAISMILSKAGAMGENGAGHADIFATNIECGSSKSDSRAYCYVTVSPDGDKQLTKKLNAKASDTLLQAMIGAGAADCGMESCHGSAKNLDCGSPLDPSLKEGTTCNFSN